MIERRHGHVEHAGERPRARFERYLAPRILSASGSRAADDTLEFDVAPQQVAHRATHGLVAADPEQVFGGFVQVDDGAIGVQPYDRGGYAVQQFAEFIGR
jgi:hypothetical protein